MNRDNAPQSYDRENEPSRNDFSAELAAFRKSARPDMIHGGIRFHSRCEVACAVLLERYVPGFRIREGETYQVPIGFGRFVDFALEKDGRQYLIEYHPANLKFEMNPRAYGKLCTALAQISKQLRREIREAVREDKFADYVRKRFFCIQHSPLEEVQKSTLIVCDDPIKFYRLVIKKFGHGYPDEKKFLREWYEEERTCGRGGFRSTRDRRVHD